MAAAGLLSSGGRRWPGGAWPPSRSESPCMRAAWRSTALLGTPCPGMQHAVAVSRQQSFQPGR
eukprot:11143401-Alexandrium_andersonii.AAC.1